MSISFDSIACAQTQHSLMHVNRGARAPASPNLYEGVLHLCTGY